MSTLTTRAAELRLVARLRSAPDHAGTIRSFYPYWDPQYRPFLLLAVDALPVDHYDFKPRPEMMTAHQLVLHVAEAERWWMHHIVDGEPYEDYVVPRADPAEGYDTAIDAPDADALREVLERCHERTQSYLDRPVAELSRVVTFQPPKGAERRFTLHWILDHLQEHEIHHRGQLNMYLRMIGVEPPSI